MAGTYNDIVRSTEPLNWRRMLDEVCITHTRIVERVLTMTENNTPQQSEEIVDMDELQEIENSTVIESSTPETSDSDEHPESESVVEDTDDDDEDDDVDDDEDSDNDEN